MKLGAGVVCWIRDRIIQSRIDGKMKPITSATPALQSIVLFKTDAHFVSSSICRDEFSLTPTRVCASVLLLLFLALPLVRLNPLSVFNLLQTLLQISPPFQ